MKMFEVVYGGVNTTFQDLGRYGYDDIGVPNSGASDELSYLLTNKLLSNPKGSVALEVTIGKLKLKALNDARVSIGGADTRAKLNGTHIKNWSAFPVKKGDILEFGYAIDGQISYLSIEGGFEAPKILNSCSVGKFIGSPLKKGDILRGKISKNRQRSFLSNSIIPKLSFKELTLRFIKGYQWELFDIDRFCSLEFKVSNRYNKMGYQLNANSIKPKHTHLISEAIAFGAIQITAAGFPIILLKDRQTIGGYPKIGSVLSIDCFKLSQCGANTTIRFKEIKLQKAQQKMKDFYNKIKYL